MPDNHGTTAGMNSSNEPATPCNQSSVDQTELVAALLAVVGRWERLADQEEATAAMHAGNGSDQQAANLRGWMSGRVVCAKDLRRVLEQHTSAPGGGQRTT